MDKRNRRRRMKKISRGWRGGMTKVEGIRGRMEKVSRGGKIGKE